MACHEVELKGRFDFLLQDRIIFGSDSVNQLESEVKRLGASRAFIVTTSEIAATELLERTKKALGGPCVGAFAGVIPHVPRQMVVEAAKEARKAGAELLISLGGGSCTDTARATALAMAEDISAPSDFDRYKADFLASGMPSITKRAPMHIAVPTTLSAAEYDAVAGVTDTERKVKELYTDPQLVPRVVILDPSFTQTTPMWVWLSTGIKAVDHCVERLYSKAHHPFTDALTYQALGTLFHYLPLTQKRPNDLAIRGQLQIASWLSMFGIGNVNLGLSHGIGHQLGGRCNVPHGYTSCIMLPPVMEFNRPVTAERQALVAKAAGIDIRGMSSEKASVKAYEAVKDLINTLGLPQRLRDVGVKQDDFSAIANDTMKDPIVTNPRPVTSEAQIIKLLETAW